MMNGFTTKKRITLALADLSFSTRGKFKSHEMQKVALWRDTVARRLMHCLGRSVPVLIASERCYSPSAQGLTVYSSSCSVSVACEER